MYLVAELELGQRSVDSKPSAPSYYIPNSHSSDYPWASARQAVQSTTHIEELNEDLEAGVEATYADSDTLCKNFKPHHYFQYVAGTSTGGLSAIMLGRMEMTVDEALAQYDVVGNLVFGKPRFLHKRFRQADYLKPRYPSKNMALALQQVIQNGLREEMRQWKHKPEDVPLESDSNRCRT